MTALLRFTAAAISALAMSAWAHAAPQPKIQPATVDAIKPRLTVLYDAFGKASDMQKDWGYSALVEAGGKRILFDTGNAAAAMPVVNDFEQVTALVRRQSGKPQSPRINSSTRAITFNSRLWRPSPRAKANASNMRGTR